MTFDPYLGIYPGDNEDDRRAHEEVRPTEPDSNTGVRVASGADVGAQASAPSTPDLTTEKLKADAAYYFAQQKELDRLDAAIESARQDLIAFCAGRTEPPASPAPSTEPDDSPDCELCQRYPAIARFGKPGTKGMLVCCNCAPAFTAPGDLRMLKDAPSPLAAPDLSEFDRLLAEFESRFAYGLVFGVRNHADHARAALRSYVARLLTDAADDWAPVPSGSPAPATPSHDLLARTPEGAP